MRGREGKGEREGGRESEKEVGRVRGRLEEWEGGWKKVRGRESGGAHIAEVRACAVNTTECKILSTCQLHMYMHAYLPTCELAPFLR